MSSLPHTLFFFIVALVILIAVHEYGHFWVARQLGVKVLRFSLGFGKIIWRYQKSPGDTEFTLSALPLGGYVKMVDERETEVAPEDLPVAFNRQPVSHRAAIVLAGPVFNFFLAILIYWLAFMWGETGTRPVLGAIKTGTLAEQAGLKEGDEIQTVGGGKTPTWALAISQIMDLSLDDEPIAVTVTSSDGVQRELRLVIPEEDTRKPDELFKKLGLTPWEPELEPLVDRVEPGSAAATAGLMAGDRVISADATAIRHWKQWVEYVRHRPEQPIRAIVDRDGVHIDLIITPHAEAAPEGTIGRIGAAVRLPDNLLEAMTVEYRLGVLPALVAATKKTQMISMATLKMAGRMLIGKAGVENLSGPISIAQYAGKSASYGFGSFMQFLAMVSISLGVLNLLPIPMLDGGHLMFYLIEAVKGSPLSDDTQMRFQQIGMFLLLSLMVLGFYLDIGRLFAS